MSAAEQDRSQEPLAAVIQACSEQTQRFRERRTHDPSYCFELFRRAICDGCQRAWAAVYRQYESQVRSWVGTGYKARGALLERGDVVTTAYARFSQAITAENFEHFDSLKALLFYLQRCTFTSLVDMTRREEPENTELIERVLADLADESMEAEVLDTIGGSEIWQYILTRLNDPAEERVMIASYIYDLPPREISDRWPAMFPDAQAVYRIKERIITRLSRDPRLRGLFDVDA